MQAAPPFSVEDQGVVSSIAQGQCCFFSWPTVSSLEIITIIIIIDGIQLLCLEKE